MRSFTETFIKHPVLAIVGKTFEVLHFPVRRVRTVLDAAAADDVDEHGVVHGTSCGAPVLELPDSVQAERRL
jgi:hypothetical protein